MVECTLYQISLLNVIDTTPSFDKSHDEVKVSEKILTNTSIYQLSLTYEGSVSFHFHNLTTSVTQAMFTLWDNGVITLSPNAYLDYDTTTRYDLYIYGQLGSPALDSNIFWLIIKVIDVNDNSPVFSANSYSFSALENSTAGTVVGTVLATDADGTSANNNVAYYKSNNAFSNNFAIGQSSGIITVVGGLNYEYKKEYVFTVCSTDNATDANEQVPTDEKRSTCVPVTIAIRNINEYRPTFSTPFYSIKISEKSPDGFEIFRFSATDGDNTTVYFDYDTIQTSAGDMVAFQLNNMTGVLTLKASQLDFEIQSAYNLYVQAIDSVSLLGGGKARLNIELVDINDNSPVFSSNLFQVSIMENASIGDLVTTVSASDKDGVSNGKMIYSILKNHYSEKFSINLTTGDISVAETLDYEEKIYKFVITVCANDSATDDRQNNPGIINVN